MFCTSNIRFCLTFAVLLRNCCVIAIYPFKTFGLIYFQTLVLPNIFSLYHPGVYPY